MFLNTLNVHLCFIVIATDMRKYRSSKFETVL